ncbi:SRPBCC family protein [Actinospica sp. MGRD01-02]|uniref:SRPBCC family protein n=1 Tax=Actinospica acidithermotolerans TaxID=2828514 RepID=A0A941EGI5_9ACTN|nr:SRPBCC family protein [Actinospica acidithermotolerans]MBR7829983.1 SRPBCC family protein [Actinospica acidithermotolerans]
MDAVRHGVLNRFGEQWTIRFQRELGHPPDRVWSALTDRGELAIWFPTGVVGDWSVGASLSFPFPDAAFPAMHGTVLQLREPRVLEYTWGPDTLLYRLEAGGTGTHLDFVVTLEELGSAARDGAGWHEALDLLETVLDGAQRWPLGQRWAELAPSYRAAFGPDASTIGPPAQWSAPEA